MPGTSVSKTTYMSAPDTIARMEQALMHRFDEGRALQSIRRGYWAIYTLGYVVELCLKTAFLRIAGLKTNDDAKHFVQGGFARKWAKAMGVSRNPGQMHNLLFWLDLIVEERSFSGRPINVEFTREFALRVQQVATHWRPEMRYHPSVDTGERTASIATSSKWILDHHWLLWS